MAKVASEEERVAGNITWAGMESHGQVLEHHPDYSKKGQQYGRKGAGKEKVIEGNFENPQERQDKRTKKPVYHRNHEI